MTVIIVVNYSKDTLIYCPGGGHACGCVRGFTTSNSVQGGECLRWCQGVLPQFGLTVNWGGPTCDCVKGVLSQI